MTVFDGTTDELELLLLERRLDEYAQTEIQDGPLDVNAIFDGAMMDMGYDKLVRTMDLFSDRTVREVAQRVFAKYSKK